MFFRRVRVDFFPVKFLRNASYVAFHTPIGIGALLAVAGPIVVWLISSRVREELLLRYGGVLVEAEVIDLWEGSGLDARDNEVFQWGLVYRFRTAEGREVTGSAPWGSGHRPAAVEDVDLPSVVYAEHLPRFPEINRLRVNRDLAAPWNYWPIPILCAALFVFSPVPGIMLVKRGWKELS